MKLIRYFFYFLIFIFLIFLSIGFINPRLEYDAEVLVEEPSDKIWSIFVDTTRFEEWITNFKSVEILNGNITTPGSKLKLIVIDEGTLYTLIETVESVKLNESYVIKIENDFLTNQIEYTFTGTEKVTLIRSLSILEGKGALMKSVFSFMKGMFHWSHKLH